MEIGFGNTLTRLVDDILYNHEHEAIALCPLKNKNSLEQFELAMAKLAVRVKILGRIRLINFILLILVFESI